VSTESKSQQVGRADFDNGNGLGRALDVPRGPVLARPHKGPRMQRACHTHRRYDVLAHAVVPESCPAARGAFPLPDIVVDRSPVRRRAVSARGIAAGASTAARVKVSRLRRRINGVDSDTFRPNLGDTSNPRGRSPVGASVRRRSERRYTTESRLNVPSRETPRPRRSAYECDMTSCILRPMCRQ